MEFERDYSDTAELFVDFLAQKKIAYVRMSYSNESIVDYCSVTVFSNIVMYQTRIVRFMI